MDAINLQGIWTNYAGTTVVSAPRRTHGGMRFDWLAWLAAYEKKALEEEKEQARKKEKFDLAIKKLLEKIEERRREREAAEELELVACLMEGEFDE